MTEKIMTKHPMGKIGVNIDRAKYEAIRAAILTAVTDNGDIAFQELPAAVEERLSAPFQGSLGWYITTIKLDMEARGEIERIPHIIPQRLRLVA